MRSALLFALSFAACDQPLPDDEAGLGDDTGGNWLPADQSAPPLDLTVTDLVPGQQVQFTLTGANPGDRVTIGRSMVGQGAGPCPVAFNGMCSDLRSPTPMMEVTANAQGTASALITLPPNVPNGANVWFQAYQYRGAGSPYKSDVVHKVVGTPCAEDALEDNDTRGTASTGQPGAVPNLRSCDGDPDWYAITLAAGATLDVLATFRHNQGNIDLRLTNSAGTQLAGAASLTDDETLTYTSPSAQTVYLAAVLTGDAGNSPGNGYALDIDVSSAPTACVDDAFEPNNTSGTATTIQPGAFPDMSICSLVQDDYYRLLVPAGRTLNVDLAFDHNEGDIELFLYNNQGGGFLGASQGTTNTESVSWFAAQDTTVNIRVTMFPDGGAFTGNFYDMNVAITP